MVPMKALRSLVGVAQLVALVTGLAMLCPCPVMATASDAGEEHGCCASEGFRAATSCCLTTASREASALAQFAPAPLVPMLADAPALLASASAAPIVRRAARLAAPPAPVLRI